MRTWILPFEDIGRTDVAVAGGKGANLGELVGKGFPVPSGFVVSAEACRSFFNEIDLQQEVTQFSDTQPDSWGELCATVQKKIHAADMGTVLSDAILSAHADLIAGRNPETRCAVRSSATAEDLGNASFAGQHATYYYVDHRHLLSMIKHCWASLFHPETVSYRSTQGIDHAAVWMAVIVQEMIASEISGVTFTANPLTGSRDEVVTESSWGMGAAIVDGRVTPDHYVVDRSGLSRKEPSCKICERRIADKRYMVPSFLAAGAKTRLQPVSHAMRQKETLSLDMLRVVSQWAVKAEDHFGSPQDVEWAVAGNTFYMLQSRPITVMGREEIGAGIEGPYVIFKPLLENFTDPITPLTADCYQFLFSPPMMRMIKGWLYVNLKTFRAVFPFNMSDETLASLLYDFGKETPRLKLPLLKLPLLMLQALLAYLLFGVFFARTRGLPADFMDNFRQLAHQIDKDPSCSLIRTQHRLLWWSKLFDPAGNQVMFVNFSSLRYFLSLRLLEKILARWLPDLRKGAASLLCSGTAGVLSAEMGREIWNLAKAIKKEPRLKTPFEKETPENIMNASQAMPGFEKFRVMLRRFLSRNGHRGLKELELQSLRWEENPTPVLGMIRNYMLMETDPAEHERRVDQTRYDLEKDIQNGLADLVGERILHFRRRLIWHLLRVTKYFSRTRENSRFYHTLGFYVVRKKILQMEKACLLEGKLRCNGDIFYLRLEEALRLQQGHLGWADVEERIRARRMQHIRLSKISPPKTINVDVKGTVPKDSEPDISNSDTFTGQPASPGLYEGTARVIMDPSIDVELKPGEILVAPYTDPAWTPLFLTAGAAIVEIGSYLSHAGTVAREFGMPCVVDLPGCTQFIQTGCRVHVDGDRGVVTVIEKN
jgi:pyruvate,water dikinase